jgi:hypothetical protein
LPGADRKWVDLACISRWHTLGVKLLWAVAVESACLDGCFALPWFLVHHSVNCVRSGLLQASLPLAGSSTLWVQHQICCEIKRTSLFRDPQRWAFVGLVDDCGLASSEPSHGLLLSNPFQTPVEIVPEWYFVPTFNVLRTLEDKSVGVLSLVTLPLGLLLTPPVENSVPWQNPFRRVVAMSNTLSFLGHAAIAAIGAAASIHAAFPSL